MQAERERQRHVESPPTDRQLVDDFRRGSKRAYDAIYRTYRGRVTRTCRKYLSDDRDVEEAVQDTFTRAYLALDRFNGQFRLGAWLSQIATNASLDRLRRNHRRVETTPLEGAPDRADAAPGPEVMSSVGDIPHNVLETMKVTHVQALLLRAEGYSHAEIAHQLGGSPAQAKALLHRARESFKRAWNAAGTVSAVAVFAVAGAAAVRLVRIGTGTVGAASRVQSAVVGTADVVAAPLASVTAEAELLL